MSLIGLHNLEHASQRIIVDGTWEVPLEEEIEVQSEKLPNSVTVV